MAAPAPTFFSALYTDAAKWNEPAPDYTFYSTRVGGAATRGGGLDRAATITTLANLATHSPTMVAFVPDNDQDVIYVGHSLTLYPSDPANVLPFDDSVVVLVGNDPGSCQPMVAIA